ncbi:Integrase catalytic domain-containing protein [Mycena kentingensis (nom. inval.)]|nr:Integrase catalytic domain-containing protein [Mycena kentingensis (nom. inval.)]
MAYSPLRAFLMEADRISMEAQFIVDSLPNAELAAAERAVHQLGAVRQIVTTLDEEAVPEDHRQVMVAAVETLLRPLEEFIYNPPPTPATRLTTEETGGRPRYQLDMDRVKTLHDLGNTYAEIAQAMGVGRATIYRHASAEGMCTARRLFTEIDDDELDERVAEISLNHPFVGSIIVNGHLEAQGIHLSRIRVQESLRRVDEMGMLVRWAGNLKRRVYKVRGANALWHHDGNEKLRRWGFYVHGCVDGHSRLIVYLAVRANKRQATVAELFMGAVARMGWPSRMRGDYGTENNEVERLIIAHWGAAHRAYLRGRSRHNIRIERLWRDIRKDSLETYRQIFDYLEKNGLLDIEDEVQRTCLYLVFAKRIQTNLDRSREAWNHHRIRTERQRTPVAIFELSREAAIQRGYWTGDAGDAIEDVDDMYGVDGAGPVPQENDDPLERLEQPTEFDAQRRAGILVNDDDELHLASRLLDGFDVDRDDGNWGIDVYCEAVLLMHVKLQSYASQSYMCVCVR